MVRGAAITIRIPGEAGFQGAPGCLARDWIFVHTPGLPLASFAVSRDFLVLGEQCLTRRARSREGCSVPFLSPFALFAASREPSVQGGDNISREEHEVAKDVFPPHNWNPSRLPRDFSVQGENNVSREGRE